MVGEKLYEAYAAQGKQEEGLNRLIGYMQTFPDLDLINVIYEKALLLKGETEAAQIAVELVRQKPDLNGVYRLLGLKLSSMNPEWKADTDMIRSIIGRQLQKASCTAAATATSNPKSSSGTAQPATNGKPLRRIKSRFDKALSIKKRPSEIFSDGLFITKQNIKTVQNMAVHTSNICSTPLLCPCQRRYNLRLNIGIKFACSARIAQFCTTGFICRNLV